jgi:hypothetical protein
MYDKQREQAALKFLAAHRSSRIYEEFLVYLECRYERMKEKLVETPDLSNGGRAKEIREIKNRLTQLGVDTE